MEVLPDVIMGHLDRQGGKAWGHYPGTGVATFLPTAAATAISRAMRAWKFSKLRDWAPSLRAIWGLGCTSMRRPSAPATTAARARGVTRSHLPVPWLGSAMIGRWLSFLMIGMALMSMVLRV